MAVKEKASVTDLPKYKVAKSLREVSEEYGFSPKDMIKLAGNENRFGCSQKVIEELIRQQADFSYYPDANVTLLREKLSCRLHLAPENFVFGNGSFELLSLIGEAYIDKGDEAIFPDPSFGWYLNVTFKNQGKVVRVPVTEEKAVDTEGILRSITDKTKVIWLCNPNNPTGTLIPGEKLRSFVSSVPENVLIVLDEAYVDFIDGPYVDTIELMKQYDNVILLRTFSKAQGLASFRVGYGMAQREIIENILKVKMPINLGLAAQIAALASLEDDAFTEFVIKATREQLRYYYREFEKLNLEYVPSHGNFVLLHTGKPGAYVENEFLKRGILIRNGEEFGLEGWVRISVGKPEENEKVIAVLKEILRGQYE